MAKKKNLHNLQSMKNEALRRIMENENDYVVKDGEMYDVHAFSLHFRCCFSDEEMDQIASLCLELMEELRSINDSGYSREDLERAKEEVKESVDTESIFWYLNVCKRFMTEKADKIVRKIGVTARVGGAYYYFISRPTFMQAVYYIFDGTIDNFTDVNDYFTAFFMLILMAMHMHSDEVAEEDQI